MFYICASPLVKIFLPEWHERLLEDPAHLTDYETDFEFGIDTGTSTIIVKFNKPQQILSNDYKTGLNIYNWLTGGTTGATSRDTDCYGVVQFDTKINMSTMLDDITMLDALTTGDPKKAKAAKEKADAKRKEASEAILAAHHKVRIASETRLRRALKFSHNNLLKQWQINDENKIGRHQPSVAEMLGFKALESEIAAASKKGANIKTLANDMMTRPNM